MINDKIKENDCIYACTIANKIVAPENVMLSSWLSVLHFNFLHIHMHLKKHILRTTVSIVYES